jgi:mannose-6-phosphate isomerase-like protein (cupin superfamily)
MSRATVLAPGEGDKYWIVGDHGTFKIGPRETGGRYTVAETFIPLNAGPPPHVHGNEDEMFYILAGRIMFMDNQHTFIAGPGAAVYLPKGVPHTFKNIGDEPVKCVLTALPSGFEAFVAECGQKIDKIPCDLQVDDAAIGKLLANCQKYGIQILPEHKVLGEKQVTPKTRKLWVMGNLIDVKLTAEDTAGNFSVAEITQPPGASVPLHAHVEMDEYFHVIEGETEFTIAGKPVKATAGTFIHVPKGVSHGFTNKSGKPAKIADFHTPGGFEKFFEECGVACTDETMPPKPVAMEPAALEALFKKHGMTVG